MTMRSKRFAIASLHLDAADVQLRYADLLVVAHEESPQLDWECVVMPATPAVLEQGAYRIALVTDDGRALDGDAVLVRTVQGTHVLRGAGPLHGLSAAELQ